MRKIHPCGERGAKGGVNRTEDSCLQIKTASRRDTPKFMKEAGDRLDSRANRHPRMWEFLLETSKSLQRPWVPR